MQYHNRCICELLLYRFVRKRDKISLLATLELFIFLGAAATIKLLAMFALNDVSGYLGTFLALDTLGNDFVERITFKLRLINIVHAHIIQ
jgi:hypothetical protein